MDRAEQEDWIDKLAWDIVSRMNGIDEDTAEELLEYVLSDEGRNLLTERIAHRAEIALAERFIRAAGWAIP